MKRLRENGYIEVDENGFLGLTEQGEEIGSSIYERHTVLSELLMRLGVDKKTAAEDACKMEHAISDTSFAAIKQHFLKHS